MSSTIQKMNELKKRASQRRISFSGQKNEKDTKVENNYFNDLKELTYIQIARNK